VITPVINNYVSAVRCWRIMVRLTSMKLADYFVRALLTAAFFVLLLSPHRWGGPLLVLSLLVMGLWAMLYPQGLLGWVKTAHPNIDVDDRSVWWVPRLLGGFVVIVLLVALAASSSLALRVRLRDIVRPHGTLLEAGMLLIFALAWLWWGISLWFRPDSFIKRANVRLPRWLVKVFGAVLLLGAVKFAYEFGVRAKALFR